MSMGFNDYLIKVYGKKRGAVALFLKDNPDVLPQEVTRWRKTHLVDADGNLYLPSTRKIKVTTAEHVIRRGCMAADLVEVLDDAKCQLENLAVVQLSIAIHRKVRGGKNIVFNYKNTVNDRSVAIDITDHDNDLLFLDGLVAKKRMSKWTVYVANASDVEGVDMYMQFTSLLERTIEKLAMRSNGELFKSPLANSTEKD